MTSLKALLPLVTLRDVLSLYFGRRATGQSYSIAFLIYFPSFDLRMFFTPSTNHE